MLGESPEEQAARAEVELEDVVFIDSMLHHPLEPFAKILNLIGAALGRSALLNATFKTTVCDT